MTLTSIDISTRSLSNTNQDMTPGSPDKEVLSKGTDFSALMSTLIANFPHSPSVKAPSSLTAEQFSNAEISSDQGLPALEKITPFQASTVEPMLLTAFHLGPHLQVITPQTAAPEGQSLELFARSQGLDEAALQWLMATPTMAKTPWTTTDTPESNALYAQDIAISSSQMGMVSTLAAASPKTEAKGTVHAPKASGIANLPVTDVLSPSPVTLTASRLNPVADTMQAQPTWAPVAATASEWLKKNPLQLTSSNPSGIGELEPPLKSLDLPHLIPAELQITHEKLSKDDGAYGLKSPTQGPSQLFTTTVLAAVAPKTEAKGTVHAPKDSGIANLPVTDVLSPVTLTDSKLNPVADTMQAQPAWAPVAASASEWLKKNPLQLTSSNPSGIGELEPPLKSLDLSHLVPAELQITHEKLSKDDGAYGLKSPTQGPSQSFTTTVLAAVAPKTEAKGTVHAPKDSGIANLPVTDVLSPVTIKASKLNPATNTMQAQPTWSPVAATTSEWLKNNTLQLTSSNPSGIGKLEPPLKSLDLSHLIPADLQITHETLSTGDGSFGQESPSQGQGSFNSRSDLSFMGRTDSPVNGSAMPEMDSAQRRESLKNLAEKMGQAVGQRILSELERGQWHLKLSLRPATLGHIEVEMRMRSGEMDAVFSAGQALTRELLNEGMSKLKDTLNQMGMDVANLRVDDGQNRQRGGDSTPDRQANVKDNAHTESADTTASQPVKASTKMGVDGWDVLV